MNEDSLTGGGFPVEWFVSPSEVSRCKICRNILKQPKYGKCGHISCSSCIKRDGDNRFFCPQCNLAQDENDLVTCQFAVETISELLVHCSCHSKGEYEECEWNGMFKERAGRNCCFQRLKCENVGCEVMTQRRHMNHHLESECEMRNVSCKFVNCGTIVPQCEIATHSKVCAERPVKCKCGVIVTFSKLPGHQNTDCALSFVDCPRYRVNMCDASCTGKVKRDDLPQHRVHDLDAMNEMADEIVRLRVLAASLAPVVNHQEMEEVKAEECTKRPFAAISPLTETSDDFHDEPKRQQVEKIVSVTSSSSSPGDDPAKKGSTHVAAASPSASGVDLFVNNLSEHTTEAAVRTVFQQFGTIRRVSVPAHPNGRCKGFAFVKMSSPAEAQFAIQIGGDHGLWIDGQKINLELSRVTECFSIQRLPVL